MLLCSEAQTSGQLRSHVASCRHRSLFGVSNGHRSPGRFRHKRYSGTRYQFLLSYDLSRYKSSCSLHVKAATSLDGQLASRSHQAASHQATLGSSRTFGCTLLRDHRPPAGQGAFIQQRCKVCARASTKSRAGVHRLIKRQDRDQLPFKLPDPESAEQVKPPPDNTAEQQTTAGENASGTCLGCDGRGVQIVDGVRHTSCASLALILF